MKSVFPQTLYFSMTIMVPGKQEAGPLSPEPELSSIPLNYC